MNTVTKTLLRALLGISLIVVLTMLGITTFVNPNQLKTTLEQTVLAETGHILTIKDSVRLNFTPFLTFTAKDITLSKPSSGDIQQDLLTIQEAKIQPDFWPLLIGKFFVTLNLQGLNINLEQKVSGKTNWSDIQEKIENYFLTQKNLNNKVIVGLKINNGKIHLIDLKNGEETTLSKITVSLKNIHLAHLGKTIPLKIYFEPEKNNLNLKSIELAANWKFDEQLKKLDIQNLQLTAKPETGESFILSGNFKIEELGLTPSLHGKINIGKKGTLETNLKWDVTKDIQTLAMQGSVVGKNISLGNFLLNEIQLPIQGKAGVIDCNPIDFQILSSRQQAMLQIDLTKNKPKISFSAEGEEFEMNDFLTLWDAKGMIEGRAQLKTSLITQGTTLEEFKRNLSGHTDLSISEGKLQGIELIPLLQHAQSTIKSVVNTLSQDQKINTAAILAAELGEWKKQASHSNKLMTPFDKIQASGTITNGILYNPDLILTHSNYSIDGQGSLNLFSGNIEYRALALLKKSSIKGSEELTGFFAETPLPIQVKATFKHPAVRPNLDEYTSSALQFVKKNTAEKTAGKAFEKLFESP